MTTNQSLADATVLARLRLLELEGEAVRQMTSRYLAAVAPVLEELTLLHAGAVDRGGTFTVAERRRVKALQAELTAATRAVHGEMRTVMLRAMQAGAGQGAAGVAQILQSTLPTALAGDVAAVSLADAAASIFTPIGGLRWTDRLARDLVEQHDRLQAILGNAAATGASMPKVAEGIRTGTTIVETYRGRFVAIARTEVQRVSNDAAQTTYRANADVIKEVQWLATLDDRTCLTCAGLHEQTWPIDEPHPTPPAHPNCRCFLTPVTKTWQELGLGDDADARREMDGRAASLMDFDSWLGRQPVETQESVLGSKAAVEEWKGGESIAALAAPSIAAIR